MNDKEKSDLLDKRNKLQEECNNITSRVSMYNSARKLADDIGYLADAMEECCDRSTKDAEFNVRITPYLIVESTRRCEKGDMSIEPDPEFAADLIGALRRLQDRENHKAEMI